jgi:protein-tyrosine phosphatase
MKSYLFVCLGNICRSPLCEGFAKYYSKKFQLNLTIDSAGTSAYHVGENPCEISQKIASQNQINISQLQSRQVTQEDFFKFDLIVALDNQNLKDLKNMGCKNVVKLGDFGYEGADVPDPYYYQDQIDVVWDMIEVCITNLIKSYTLNQV